jgi:hypothetical protein
MIGVIADSAQRVVMPFNESVGTTGSLRSWQISVGQRYKPRKHIAAQVVVFGGKKPDFQSVADRPRDGQGLVNLLPIS